MKPANTLFILSDEHNKRVLGCHGHPMIQTPNLDALASRGTRFTNAYTNCPICVPARASFATGRYVHEHRCWDNAIAYDGKLPSWGHRLMAQGHHVVSIGKLHYASGDDAKRNGFDEEILPMHIVNGTGDLVCADEAGIAIIPQDKIAVVLELSQKIDAGDTKRQADIDKGVGISDLGSNKYK